MNVQLIKATLSDKDVIKNLMQLYIYDFSEFVACDVEKNGLFKPYPDLDDYWEEGNGKFPYIIQSGNKYAGFVLIRYIRSGQQSYFSMAEFFVMKKFRRKGIGKLVAGIAFTLHKGRWEIYQKESNKPAQLFWTKVIGDFTKGQFEERFEKDKRIQCFEIA